MASTTPAQSTAAAAPKGEEYDPIEAMLRLSKAKPPRKSKLNSPANVVGRFLIAVFFLSFGCRKLIAIQPKTEDPVVVARALEPVHRGIAFVNNQLGMHIQLPEEMHKRVVITLVLLECMGGFLFVMNHAFGAGLLLLYTLPTTLLVHKFWEHDSDSVEFENELMHFMKNLSIMGALICFMATTDGVPLRTKRKEQLEFSNLYYRTTGKKIE